MLLELSQKEICRERSWSRSRERCWISKSVPIYQRHRAIADVVVKRTVNNMVDSLRLFAAEVTRVAKEVGIDGQLGGQAYVYVLISSAPIETDDSRSAVSMVNLRPTNCRRDSSLTICWHIVSGEWKSLVDSVNQMAGNLTDQVRSIAKATVCPTFSVSLRY